MKKLLCFLCLLLALVCVFAACDGETPNTDGDTPNTEQNGGGDTNQGGDGDQSTTHTHAYGEWSVSKAATCTAKGEEKRTCSCGESETREIAMLSHTYGEWSTSKAATCGAKGEEKRTCACGESETREIAMLSHTYGEWSTSKAATCTAKGEEKRTCACGESETREIAMLAHTYGEWSVSKAATCTAKGEEKRTCTGCPAFETQEIAATGEHTYGEWSVTKAATCVDKGEEKRACTGCPAFETQEIAATGEHIYVQGVCSCGALEPADTPYIRDGNKIYFGTYPQSEVTEATLISTLNSKAGTLPTSSNAQSWTSYGYYISGSVSNYMWYIDVTEGGEEYRGVYFTSYRPYYTTSSSSADYTYQDDNGYTTGTVYWFKYEPIAWTILKEERGTALLLCDMIIDSQQFDYDGSYSNNYAQSTIRAWLNDTFYETAFDEYQQTIILTTTVDNSVASTGYTSNPYTCEDTNDKVFLLSAEEVMTAEYGFTTNTSSTTTREKQTTAYAQVQGAWTSTSTDYAGNGVWWLRSPYYSYSHIARGVYIDGYVYYGNYVYNTYFGVVPALQIRLN